ncbi:hypothetical protein [Methanosarcina sp. KYL-1]|uniref:hypothetical protein n=1 Tax=Methanosarcina sp. KYL-1 TaxID=2602068 RepID=UPI00210120BD|nr:hypothetical protein [Methanosarcina sp. KYL-1]
MKTRIDQNRNYFNKTDIYTKEISLNLSIKFKFVGVYPGYSADLTLCLFTLDPVSGFADKAETGR